MRLNDALTENNIESLKKIGNKKGLSEDQITAGIGIHLVRKLTGGYVQKCSAAQTQYTPTGN